MVDARRGCRAGAGGDKGRSRKFGAVALSRERTSPAANARTLRQASAGNRQRESTGTCAATDHGEDGPKTSFATGAARPCSSSRKIAGFVPRSGQLVDGLRGLCRRSGARAGAASRADSPQRVTKVRSDATDLQETDRMIATARHRGPTWRRNAVRESPEGVQGSRRRRVGCARGSHRGREAPGTGCRRARAGASSLAQSRAHDSSGAATCATTTSGPGRESLGTDISVGTLGDTWFPGSRVASGSPGPEHRPPRSATAPSSWWTRRVENISMGFAPLLR